MTTDRSKKIRKKMKDRWDLFDKIEGPKHDEAIYNIFIKRLEKRDRMKDEDKKTPRVEK